MTAEPKRRSAGRTILTIIVALIVACAVCGIVAYVVVGPSITKVFNTVVAPLTAGNDFMTALVAKDYPKAYAMISPAQQASFGGSPDGLKETLASKGMEPSSFSLNNFQFNDTDAIVNGTGSFSGNTKYVYLYLKKEGDNWKVNGMDINDNPPTATPTK